MLRKHLFTAAVLTSALVMSSCSFLTESQDSGNLSLTLDGTTISAIQSAARNANNQPDPHGFAETLYIDVSLKGDISVSKTITAKENKETTITFEKLKRGAKVYLKADAYIKEPGLNEKYILYTGSSDTIKVHPGQNTVSLKLKKLYSIWFDANGGILPGDLYEQRIVSGGKISRPEDPERASVGKTAFEFAGWYTSENGGFTLSDKPYNFDTPVKGDMVLYAKWLEKQIFTVSFDANGGTCTIEDQLVVDGKTATAPEAVPSKESDEDFAYIFSGWYTSSSCEASTKFDFTTPVTADTILYAGWTKKRIYKVSFDTTGGEDVETQRIIDGMTAKKPRTPYKAPSLYDGYAFVNWFTSSDGGATLSSVPFDFATPITKDITLYAKWEIKVNVPLDIDIPLEETETITVTKQKNDTNGTWIFTAPEGYNYTWKWDGEVQSATTNIFNSPAASKGTYTLTLLATKTVDGKTSYYSFTEQVEIN